MAASDVTCEVCGKYNIDTNYKQYMDICREIDLFICKGCLTSWAVLNRQLKTKIVEATTQGDIDNISKIERILEDAALDSLLKSNPLPSVTEETERKDRMDTIIFGEDHGND